MKQTEVGLIPDDWKVKRLGDTNHIETGSTPSTDNLSYYGYDKLFVSPTDLGRCKYIFQTEKKLSKKGYSVARHFPRNSILFTCIGSTIGKCGIATTDLTSNQQINAIFPSSLIDNEYLYYALQIRIEDIKGRSGQQAVPLINKTEFEQTLFLLPASFSEQQRIANALSDVDALITTTEKLIQKKKNIKQGTMQNLLTGKKRLPGFAKSTEYKQTELGLIPEDWEVKNVGSVLKIGHGRDYKKLKDGDIPVFGTGGYMASVDSFLYDGETVCIGRKGTIDKPFYHEGKIWTVDTLFYTYDFVNCIPKYIYYSFCLVDWLSMNEASGVPSLTSKNIEDVILRIPSRKEQTAIANVLSSMDKEIEILNTKLEKYRNLKTAMMQQLLTGKIRLV